VRGRFFFFFFCSLFACDLCIYIMARRTYAQPSSRLQSNPKAVRCGSPYPPPWSTSKNPSRGLPRSHPCSQPHPLLQEAHPPTHALPPSPAPSPSVPQVPLPASHPGSPPQLYLISVAPHLSWRGSQGSPDYTAHRQKRSRTLTRLLPLVTRLLPHFRPQDLLLGLPVGGNS